MAKQVLSWHCSGVFPKGWLFLPAFFEAVGYFLRMGIASRVTLK